MKEENAKIKWCPFARSLEVKNEFGNFLSGSVNRDHRGGVTAQSLCLGSKCMAWGSRAPKGHGICKMLQD